MSVLRRFTHFVLQSRFQAIGVAFLLAYIPIIGSISILIAGLVTLRKGALEGFYILLAATVPCLLSNYIVPPAPAIAEFAYVTLIVIVTSNVLVWIFAILLRKYNNWSLILEYGFLLGVLAIGSIHILYPDIQEKWNQVLTKYMNQSQQLVKELKPGMKVKQEQTVNAVKKYSTGFVVVFILMTGFLQLLIAREWQARMFNPGGLKKELYVIRMSHVAGFLFMACFVLIVFNQEMGLDIISIPIVIFAIAALSLIHALFARVKLGRRWLLLTYFITFLLFPISVVILSIVALFDVWANFRGRFSVQ